MLGGGIDLLLEGLLSLALPSAPFLSGDLLSEDALSAGLLSAEEDFSSEDFPVAGRGAPEGDRLSVEYHPEPLNTILTGE